MGCKWSLVRIQSPRLKQKATVSVAFCFPSSHTEPVAHPARRAGWSLVRIQSPRPAKRIPPNGGIFRWEPRECARKRHPNERSGSEATGILGAAPTPFGKTDRREVNPVTPTLAQKATVSVAFCFPIPAADPVAYPARRAGWSLVRIQSPRPAKRIPPNGGIFRWEPRECARKRDPQRMIGERNERDPWCRAHPLWKDRPEGGQSSHAD